MRPREPETIVQSLWEQYEKTSSIDKPTVTMVLPREDWHFFLTYHRNIVESYGRTLERETIFNASNLGKQMAYAESVLALTRVPASAPMQHHVEVVKDRRMRPSRHAFETMDDALAFIRNYLEPDRGPTA